MKYIPKLQTAWSLLTITPEKQQAAQKLIQQRALQGYNTSGVNWLKETSEITSKRKALAAKQQAEYQNKKFANRTNEVPINGIPAATQVGLKNVHPEFALMTGGVGSGMAGIKGAMGYGAIQGGLWNSAGIAGEQNLEGLVGDVIGGGIAGGVIKGASPYIKKGVKSTGELLNKSVQNVYKKIPKENSNPYGYIRRNFNPPVDELGKKLKFSVPSKIKNSETYRVMTTADTEHLLSTGKFKTSLPNEQDVKFMEGLKTTNPERYKAIKYAENSKNYTRVTPDKNYAEMHYFNDPINPSDKGNIITLKPLKNRISPSTEVGGYNELFAKNLTIDDVLHIKDRSGKVIYQSPNSKKQFKSEIDWGNWNKEIPSNKPLMDEYLQIEKTTKQNGTWMKNPDGSVFKGTPEQFVQQNSKNFRKAFPNNAEITYRGIKNNTPDLLNRSIFTADKRLAKAYTTTDDILTPFNTTNDRGLYEMYRKKSNNGIELDVRGSHWQDLDISNKIMPKSYFKKQIGYQKNNLKYNYSRMSDPNLDINDVPYLLNNKKHLENELKYFQDELLNRKNLVNRNDVDKLKAYFKNSKNTSTNDIAEYIENKNLDYIKLKNVSDNLIGTETIVNHKPGNYLKSAVGNNGMFDMTNPNIYKGLIPAIGTYGLTQNNKE